MASIQDDSSPRVVEKDHVRMVRGIPINTRLSGALFDPVEPLIPSLAKAAAKKEQPVAGAYAIERFKLPEGLEIPPESMEKEESGYFDFSLDNHPVTPSYREYPPKILESIPPELLESKGDKPYVFTPVAKEEQVVEKKEEKVPEEDGNKVEEEEEKVGGGMEKEKVGGGMEEEEEKPKEKHHKSEEMRSRSKSRSKEGKKTLSTLVAAAETVKIAVQEAQKETAKKSTLTKKLDLSGQEATEKEVVEEVSQLEEDQNKIAASTSPKGEKGPALSLLAEAKKLEREQNPTLKSGSPPPLFEKRRSLTPAPTLRIPSFPVKPKSKTKKPSPPAPNPKPVVKKIIAITKTDSSLNQK